MVALQHSVGKGLTEASMRLVSGDTDNHLTLGDLTPLGITGHQAKQALEGVGIIANKNATPYDSRPPRVPSGLRLGAPATIRRAMGTAETTRVASQVRELTAGFPVVGIDD